MARGARTQIALCWGTVIGAPLEALIDAAERQALGAITLTAGMYADSRTGGASDSALRRRLADQGVQVHAIDPLIGVLPGTPRPDEVPPEQRRYFEFTEEDCYRAAHALGAESVNLAHFGGKAVSEAAFVECLGEVAARAAREGLRLTLEFLPESAIPDLATARRIVEAIGAGNLGVMLDTWHYARTGGTVAELAALPAGAIAGLQISDRRAPPPGTVYTPMFGRLLPGEGELPLAQMLRVLLARDPALVVGVEVFSEELQRLPADEVARRVAFTTEAVLAAAAREERSADPGNLQ